MAATQTRTGTLWHLVVSFAVFPGLAQLQAQNKSQHPVSTQYKQVVQPADPGLNWDPPQPVPLGTALGAAQLSATARTAGVFQYSPDAGTVLRTGAYTLSVSFSPANPNFNRATATVPLTVEPPNGSTFDVAPLLNSRVPLNAALRATVVLLIHPVGNFLQPVTFACSSTMAVSCVFSPSSARPTTTPVSVALDVQYIPGPQLRGPAGATTHGAARDGSEPGSGEGLLFLGAVTLVAATRRRLRAADSRLVFSSLMALLVLISVFAQGCGAPEEGIPLTVTVSSLVESKSLELHLLPSE